MTILAIESSSHVCGAALVDENGLLDIHEVNQPRIHAEKLPELIAGIMKDNQLEWQSIDGLAISSGPGSYAGLRIGMSLVKGISYSRSIPIIPVPSLLALNHKINLKLNYYVCIHSHRDLVYCQQFNHQRPIEQSKCISVKKLESLPVFGFGLPDSMQTEISYTEIIPSAKLVGELALLNYEDWYEKTIDSIRPLYLTEFNIGFRK